MQYKFINLFFENRVIVFIENDVFFFNNMNRVRYYAKIKKCVVLLLITREFLSKKKIVTKVFKLFILNEIYRVILENVIK